VDKIMPELIEMTHLPREDTFVEVFKGKEGLKYVLNDTHKTKGVKEVLITGIKDEKYNELLPVFMKQCFRELKRKGIKERVITVKKEGVFMFDKKTAPTTTYRFLEQKQFNPTNTFVYADKVVVVTWGEPVMAVMIRNKGLADTYRNHFEYLWNIAEVG
ncbi:hypothetical protein KY326_01425, partial [Candidatus Woesearchaeota archaeon]|nr:hypothetical protein [Candidatus Woesearchaeota archaeon]